MSSATLRRETPRLERTTFIRPRASDFTNIAGLTKQTGHPAALWPLVAVKELIDNGLDAAEESGIAPVVTVRIDADGILVTDNGPGIPDTTIAGVLDYNVAASSRAAYVSPTRGQQGNGLKTLVAMPHVLDRQNSAPCGRLEIEACGTRHLIGFSVNQIKGVPLIKHDSEPCDREEGTSFRLYWPLSARSILDAAKGQILQLVENFAWLNPHLTISLDWGETQYRAEATDATWKKWLPSHPTSPHWYTEAKFSDLIAAQIEADPDRPIREFLHEFRGLKSNPLKKDILDQIGFGWGPTMSRLAVGDRVDHGVAARLLALMRNASGQVNPKALGIIGEDHLATRTQQAGSTGGFFRYKKVLIEGPIPLVLEAAFDYRRTTQRSLRRYAGINFSPAIGNMPFREIVPGVTLDEVLSRQHIRSEYPVAVFLHMTCPRVEYVNTGKSEVKLDRSVGWKLRDAVEKVTEPWAQQMDREHRNAEARERREENLRKYQRSKKLGFKAAVFMIMDEAYAEVSGGERNLWAHARQLMYAARRLIQRFPLKKAFLTDTYFAKLLPQYIKENAEKCRRWRIAYDPRGTLIEPHTGRKVAMGTIAVRSYLADIRSTGGGEVELVLPSSWLYPTVGPKNRYGDILFIEKEGFLPLLAQVQLAERYDIAIMSTKGMSNTASRELIDALCASVMEAVEEIASERNVRLFTIRDFDKAGFSIAGTLKRGTERFTFKNKVDVIDLGLRLEDVEDEHLESEPATLLRKRKKKDAKPADDDEDGEADDGEEQSIEAVIANLRLNGAKEAEIAFLLNRDGEGVIHPQRVELNAFTSDAFVDWIERKLKDRGVKKVIPDETTLADAFLKADIHVVRERAAAEAAKARMKAPPEVPSDLRASIETAFKEDPAQPWDAVIADLVKESFET